MQFIIILLVLLLLSFLLALRSLKHQIDIKEVGEAKETLQKGKIIFKR